MESIYPELALCGSKNESAKARFPLPRVKSLSRITYGIISQCRTTYGKFNQGKINKGKITQGKNHSVYFPSFGLCWKRLPRMRLEKIKSPRLNYPGLIPSG